MGRREKNDGDSFQLPGIHDAMFETALEGVNRGDPRVKYPSTHRG